MDVLCYRVEVGVVIMGQAANASFQAARCLDPGGNTLLEPVAGCCISKAPNAIRAALVVEVDVAHTSIADSA